MNKIKKLSEALDERTLSQMVTEVDVSVGNLKTLLADRGSDIPEEAIADARNKMDDAAFAIRGALKVIFDSEIPLPS